MHVDPKIQTCREALWTRIADEDHSSMEDENHPVNASQHPLRRLVRKSGLSATSKKSCLIRLGKLPDPLLLMIGPVREETDKTGI